MVDQLMPDVGLNALPLIISSTKRPWPGAEGREIVYSRLVPGVLPHVRCLTEHCFDLPLVAGDSVETRPVTVSGRQRVGTLPQGRELFEPVAVTKVVALVPGVLAVIGGCAAQSRRERTGPGLSGRTVPVDPYEDTPGGLRGGSGISADGIVEEWWTDVASVLVAAGCDVLDTDGDRIFAFWRWRDHPDVAQDACLAAGLPPERTQLLDHDDRARIIGRYLRMDLVPREG